MQITAAFGVVVELAEALGVGNISKMDGCWEQKIDERWAISLNGHNEPTADSTGGTIPPFHCAVLFNGWPAGFIGMNNGIIAAGEAANEDTFIAAVKRRIAECG